MKSLKLALPVLLLSVCLALTFGDGHEQCGCEQCGCEQCGCEQCGTVSNCPAVQPTAVCTELAETAPTVDHGCSGYVPSEGSVPSAESKPTVVFGEPTPAPPRTAPLVAQSRVVHHPRGQVIYVEVESSASEVAAELP